MLTSRTRLSVSVTSALCAAETNNRYDRSGEMIES